MIKLRWYQKKVAPLVFNFWRKNPDKKPIIAIPTGAGKSLIIADLIYQAHSKWNIEILVLSHRKEILTQNQSILIKYLNQHGLAANIGIYSAGLGVKEKGKITFAGIHSVYKKTKLFENVKLIIIDEVHLISPSAKGETMYQKFINELPKAKCIGLTATPYRLGSGYIVGDDHLFDEILFDLTSKSKFNRLVREGYLTKLITKRTETEFNAEGIRTIGGDYAEKELAQKFDREEITKTAVKEIIRKAKNYKKWLIFAINIDHAEHIVEELNSYGIMAIPIHSKLDLNRTVFIDAFKEGKIQALVNVNILTVGIDVPDIDLIVFLRPTKSPVLYVQSAGRGLRVAPGKDHCLVLDFARVIQTLGPINDVQVIKKKKGKGSDPVVKTCPVCGTHHHPIVKICDGKLENGEECRYEFKFKIAITKNASDAKIIAETGIHKYKVDDIYYNKHTKRNAPMSMKVTYRCGMSIFNEWVCIEHTGWAKTMADNWISDRLSPNYKRPETVDDLLLMSSFFRKPTEIVVKEDARYPEIVDYKFEDGVYIDKKAM